MCESLQAGARGARDQTPGVAKSACTGLAMRKLTPQNAALVEQTAGAAATLKAQAQGLAAEVAQFKLPA